MMSERDKLGAAVREAWINWACTQDDPKPSWLIPYEELAESDKEADRQIGEALVLYRDEQWQAALVKHYPGFREVHGMDYTVTTVHRFIELLYGTLNRCRFMLIRKHVAGTCTPEELELFKEAQKTTFDWIDFIHPLPCPDMQLLEELEKRLRAEEK